MKHTTYYGDKLGLPKILLQNRDELEFGVYDLSPYDEAMMSILSENDNGGVAKLPLLTKPPFCLTNWLGKRK